MESQSYSCQSGATTLGKATDWVPLFSKHSKEAGQRLHQLTHVQSYCVIWGLFCKSASSFSFRLFLSHFLIMQDLRTSLGLSPSWWCERFFFKDGWMVILSGSCKHRGKVNSLNNSSPALTTSTYLHLAYLTILHCPSSHFLLIILACLLPHHHNLKETNYISI